MLKKLSLITLTLTISTISHSMDLAQADKKAEIKKIFDECAELMLSDYCLDNINKSENDDGFITFQLKSKSNNTWLVLNKTKMGPITGYITYPIPGEIPETISSAASLFNSLSKIYEAQKKASSEKESTEQKS